MTILQGVGFVALYFLLAGLMCWLQWSHASPPQRSSRFYRALLASAYAAVWSGAWALGQFTDAHPIRLLWPWWVWWGVALGMLLSLIGPLLKELRWIMSLRRARA